MEKNKKKISVALSQRICPEWRVPVFKELADRSAIDLTLYFGKGRPSGAAINAEHIAGFRHKQLFTIPIYLRRRGLEKYWAFHPTLSLHLIFGRYQVVLVEPSTNIFNNIFTYPICKIFKKKFIWWEAGSPEKRSIFRVMIDPFVKRMIRGADAHVTYNSYADDGLLKMGVSAEKIFRAQTTIDTAAIMKKNETLRPRVAGLRHELKLSSAKTVLFIGALEERKRVENLIEAARVVRNEGQEVNVVIVGDGAYASKLRAFLEPGEQEHVVFVGRQVEDAPLYVLLADVVVLPGEGGLSIVDAFAAGKPCLATPEAWGGGSSVYDYVRDGQNGFVVETNNVKSLADKLSLVLEDQSLYTRLAHGALESGHELSQEKMVDGIEQAILYATSNNSGGVRANEKSRTSA